MDRIIRGMKGQVNLNTVLAVLIGIIGYLVKRDISHIDASMTRYESKQDAQDEAMRSLGRADAALNTEISVIRTTQRDALKVLDKDSTRIDKLEVHAGVVDERLLKSEAKIERVAEKVQVLESKQ